MQIVEKIRGQRKILEHIGSAHTESELAALIAVARARSTLVSSPWTWAWSRKRRSVPAGRR